MPDLSTEVQALSRRVAVLEAENAQLRAEQAPNPKRFDRRGLLRLGGVAAAASAGSVLLRPGTAGATTGAMQYGTDNAAGAASTGLASSNTTDTLHVTNSATGPSSTKTAALFAHITDTNSQGVAILAISDGVANGVVGAVTNPDSTGAGVAGFGVAGGGVIGKSTGIGPGVLGVPAGTGPGVSGWSSSGADGMEAINDDTGRALYSHIDSTTNSKQSVYALTIGTGNAVLGTISHSTSSASAIKGTTNGKGAAVEGASHAGPGGKFSGSVQVLLVPSASSTHPSSSARGVLFVDHGGRLWFCKGGTSWRQLA
jgi:hypothetical protein